MMKRVYATIIAALTLCSVGAAPARLSNHIYTQPDGSQIVLRLCGDEHYHFYTTENGDFVSLCDDGYYRFTTLDAENNLVAGDVKVSNEIKLDADVRKAIAQQHSLAYQARREMKAQRITSRRSPMRTASEAAAETEKDVKGLVLLVEFKDKKFTVPQSTMNDMMNKEGYTDDNGSIGSARDYFIAQSYGKFKPDFDVIGPITLSNNLSYYGRNDSRGNDLRPDEMVSEACEIASENGLVNMSDYDLNSDGWVDLVYVIYAGHGENAAGAEADCVWPHAWYIYQGARRTVIIDGVQLDAYACSNELAQYSSDEPDGIGTFCHEYSHTLGLPDWYDIDYSGGMGMSYWSIMDSGCYAEDSFVPINYNAYERWFCGWLELRELTEAASITMSTLNSDEKAAYKISSTNPNQYITLECRDQSGWDKGLPAEGLMVVAVDYDENVWLKNAPNDNPSRQRFQLIPADNRWNEHTLAGDLYPYGNNTSLTSSSSPKMKVFTTTINDKPITNISYSNGFASFDFKGGKTVDVDTPTATSAGNITANSFTAYWSPVNNATSYSLYVERIEEEEEIVDEKVVLEEDFALFTAPGSTDISSKLDEYTQVPGWTGSRIYCSNGEIKLGSSKYQGSIKTPAVATEAEYFIRFTAYSYDSNAESGTLTIKSYGTKNLSGSVSMSQLPAGKPLEIILPCTNGGNEVQIELSSTERIFIDNFKIENGKPEGYAPGKIIVCDRERQYMMPMATITTESCVFDGIVTTNYTVNKVVSEVKEGTYIYKVKAHTAEGESNWSNAIKVVIPGSNSVESTKTTHTAYSAHGTIYIKGTAGDVATIYNMQGVNIATITLTDGAANYTPHTTGIYIIRCGESAKKVVVGK